MAAGDLEGAAETLAAAREREPQHVELLIRQASIDLHAGELERAAESLDRALGGEVEGTHPATLVEGSLLRALVDHAAGDDTAASQALERALEPAEHEPFRDAFLLNGLEVRELLELQAQSGTDHPALLEVLLDGVGQRAPSATLLAPLTEREERILRYLPTMLSNAEIGAEVFVSLNTVKTHLRSIYRKLDASGRADAVDRARQLGLLPSGIKRPRVVQRV